LVSTWNQRRIKPGEQIMNVFRMRVANFTVAFALAVATGATAANVSIRGVVFNDGNEDGQRDAGEPGVPEVLVSDGDQIVRTDSEGHYAIETTTEIPNTVFVVNPSGFRLTNAFFHRISGSDENVDFGLAADPENAKETFSFYHTADFQFGNPRSSTAQIGGDLADMEAWADDHDVAFYAVCGDITTHGAVDDLQFFNEQFDALNRPVYRIFGGHDALVEMERPKMGNWVDAFGPYAYAWNYGGVHFIALVSEGYLSKEERARQMRWWARDMAAQPKDTPIVLLSHTPDQISAEIRDAVDEHNIAAYLFGHWHTHHNYNVDDVPFFVSSPMRPADWGAFTKRTRVMTFEEGALRSASRVLEQKKRVTVLQPTGTVMGRNLAVRAMVYDTAIEAKTVRALVFDPDTGQMNMVTLRQENDWAWHGHLKADLRPGNYAVDVQVNGDEAWSAGKSFVVGEADGAPSAMDLQWVVSLGVEQPHRTTPLVLEDRIYIAVSDGQARAKEAGVRCLDGSNGSFVWNTSLPQSINAALCSDGESVFAVDGQGGIYALNAIDGTIRWQADAYADTPFHEEQRYYWRTFLAPPTVHSDTLFVAGSHVLTALSTADGTKRWTNYQDLNRVPYPVSGLVPLNGRVYFEDEHKVVALDQSTGEQLWHRALKDLPEPVSRERGATSPVVMADGVYVHHRSRLRKLDPETGEQAWSAPSAGSMNYVGTPLVEGKNVLAANGRQVFCFDRETGERRWSFSTRPASETTLGPNQDLRNGGTPLVVDDKVIVGSDDGYLYVLSLADGHKVWEYNTGTPIKASPVRVGNRVVVGNFSGELFGFQLTGL
jgi:outer membrane protein assembly factor BamB